MIRAGYKLMLCTKLLHHPWKYCIPLYWNERWATIRFTTHTYGGVMAVPSCAMRACICSSHMLVVEVAVERSLVQHNFVVEKSMPLAKQIVNMCSCMLLPLHQLPCETIFPRYGENGLRADYSQGGAALFSRSLTKMCFGSTRLSTQKNFWGGLRVQIPGDNYPSIHFNGFFVDMLELRKLYKRTEELHCYLTWNVFVFSLGLFHCVQVQCQ